MHLDAEGNRDAAVVALLLAGGGLGLRRQPSLGRRGLGPQPRVVGCWGDGGLGRRGVGATEGCGGVRPLGGGVWGRGLEWWDAGATSG